MLIEVAVMVVTRVLKCILTRIVEIAMMPSSGACGVDVRDLREGRMSAGDTEHGRKERESGGPRGWWWYEEEMVSAVSSDRIRLWTTRRRPVEHQKILKVRVKSQP